MLPLLLSNWGLLLSNWWCTRLLGLIAKGRAGNERKKRMYSYVCFFIRFFAYLVLLFLPVVAFCLLAPCPSCWSLETALGNHAASLLLGASLAPFWHQLGSFGRSRALLGILLGLSWVSLGSLGERQGALLERDRFCYVVCYFWAFWAPFGPPNGPQNHISEVVRRIFSNVSSCGLLL